MLKTKTAHPRLVPPQDPSDWCCRWPGMDDQQAWEAQCEEHDDWLRGLGFNPNRVGTCDLFVLVKGHTARPGSWQDQVRDQAKERRARYLARLKREADARPQVGRPAWMDTPTVTLVPAGNTPYPTVDE